MLTDNDRQVGLLARDLVRRDCYRLRNLKPEPKTILDIGANVGVFSLYARILYPEARIIAIEPCPRTYARLMLNLRHWRVETHQVALTRHSTVVTHVPRSNSSVAHSTKPAEWDSADSVEGLLLSDMCERYNIDPAESFLKIDCEGSERDTLVDHHESNLALDFLYGAFELHFAEDRKGESLADRWFDPPTLAECDAFVAKTRKKRMACTYKEGNVGALLTYR